MEKKKASETGIRVTIPQGTDEAAAVDAVVTDFIKGDADAVLRDLHEPHGTHDAAGSQASGSQAPESDS